MANMIEAKEIAGGAVYGVPQMQYTVDGEEGRDYAAALAAAAFRESVAIEESAGAYAEIVRQRRRKLEDLGQVLAELAKAVAALPAKNQSVDDAVSIGNAHWVNETAKKYGVTLVFKENSDQMTRGNIQKGQNDVQYAVDLEDNALQQDMVSLQSAFSKRDNAFSTASKIVQKALKAASTAISNIN